MAETAPTRYQQTRSDITGIDTRHYKERLARQNEFADRIVNEGGVTSDVAEFALAMSGMTEYESRFVRVHDWNRWTQPEAQPYEAHEKAVEDVPGRIMLNSYISTFGPVADRYDFAMVPRDMDRAISSSTTRQPLRYTISRDETRYTGRVILPAFRLGMGDVVRLSHITLGRYVRPRGDSRSGEILPPDELEKSWHIGKSAVVGAAIKNYSTNVGQDKAFLDRLDEATKRLSKAGERLTPKELQEYLQTSGLVDDIAAD